MRQYRKLVFLLFLIGAIIIWLQTSSTLSGNMNWLEQITTTITAPAQYHLRQIFKFLPNNKDISQNRSNDQNEVVLLKQEIARLNQQIERNKNLLIENQNLRSLLNLKNEISGKQIAAEVVNRSPTSWFNIITVNKGENDGVTTNMAVRNSEGLVGRVIQTGSNFSRVMLILDPNSAVPSQIKESRAAGILYGTGKTRCEMRYITHDTPIELGNTVITSGYGKYFKKGIIIGTVTKISIQEHALFKTIEIQPRADFGALETLLLIEKPETNK